jgi:hypothetical protein
MCSRPFQGIGSTRIARLKTVGVLSISGSTRTRERRVAMVQNCDVYVKSGICARSSHRTLFLGFVFILTSLTAAAQASPQSVFVKATCDGKMSSVVRSSFMDQIRASPKYQSISNLGDNGRMDVVLHVQMSCAERNDVAAVATVYGVAKCFGPRNCHATMDGTSLRVALCDPNAVADCGRALFKAFDDYESNALATPLRLN